MKGWKGKKVRGHLIKINNQPLFRCMSNRSWCIVALPLKNSQIISFYALDLTNPMNLESSQSHSLSLSSKNYPLINTRIFVSSWEKLTYLINMNPVQTITLSLIRSDLWYTPLLIQVSQNIWTLEYHGKILFIVWDFEFVKKQWTLKSMFYQIQSTMHWIFISLKSYQ